MRVAREKNSFLNHVHLLRKFIQYIYWIFTNVKFCGLCKGYPLIDKNNNKNNPCSREAYIVEGTSSMNKLIK